MDTVESIEAMMASQEHQIRRLKTRRNALMPVFHLTTKLIIRIIKLDHNHFLHLEEPDLSKTMVRLGPTPLSSVSCRRLDASHARAPRCAI
jgi:hypothetical protein